MRKPKTTSRKEFLLKRLSEVINAPSFQEKFHILSIIETEIYAEKNVLNIHLHPIIQNKNTTSAMTKPASSDQTLNQTAFHTSSPPFIPLHERYNILKIGYHTTKNHFFRSP
jgi:hypothetical protein